jgi:hypothetical protein
LKSPRVIYTWRKKNPAIDDVVSLMQSAPLFEHRRDVIEALITVAAEADYKGHSDRKLFFEMIGDYTPRQEVDLSQRKADGDDLSGLSDEELRRRAQALAQADPGSTADGRSARSEGDGPADAGLGKIEAKPQSARAGDDGPTAQQSCAKLGLGSSSGTARSEDEEVEDA